MASLDLGFSPCGYGGSNRRSVHLWIIVGGYSNSGQTIWYVFGFVQSNIIQCISSKPTGYRKDLLKKMVWISPLDCELLEWDNERFRFGHVSH